MSETNNTRCEDVQPLIDGYIDGELDLVRNLEIEQHLALCPECGPLQQSAADLRAAIRQELPYFRASAGLEARVRAAVRQQTQPVRRRVAPIRWSWMGYAAAAAAVILVILGLPVVRAWLGSSGQDLVAQQVLDGHVRSLMAGHLTDVASTDQHTVKPWFDGKLPFAPPVTDFAQQGFPLIGGRLDYLDHHPVAALVYQRRLHYINVFVWPTNSKQGGSGGPGADAQPILRILQGYNLIEWTHAGMTFWAVSDLGTDELQMLVTLLRK